MLAAIDHAADGDTIADLVAGHAGTDRSDVADDFVAGHAGEHGAVPVVVHEVQVRMADAAVGDCDGDVVVAQGAAFDAQRGKFAVGLVGAESDAGGHGCNPQAGPPAWSSEAVFRLMGGRWRGEGLALWQTSADRTASVWSAMGIAFRIQGVRICSSTI
ncbi:hypothetical protein D3C78_1259960 [compost metagenome]